MTDSDTAWKKIAAALPDDDDSAAALEKAFSDLAYAQLQLRLKPLLQPPYRIGFEIVYSNAPDNTRLVGVFAFRVNNEILLVPSCFVDGNITGQELIYREKRKKFVPLSEAWAEFLVARGSSQSGNGIHKAVARQHPSYADMWRLGSPPPYSKSASVDELSRIKTATADMMNLLQARPSFDGALDAFVDAGLEGNVNLKAAFEAFALAAESSEKVADAMYSTGLVDRMEKAFERYLRGEAAIKQASVQNDLCVVRDVALSTVPVEKRSAFLRDGFYFVDQRIEREKLAATMSLTGEEADYRKVEDNLPPISSVTSAGVHEILLADGTSKTCAVFPISGYLEHYDSGRLTSNYNQFNDSAQCSTIDPESMREFLAIARDGRYCRAAAINLQGYSYAGIPAPEAPDGVGLDALKAMVPYVVVVAGKALDSLVRLRDVVTKNGVKHAELLKDGYGCTELQDPSKDNCPCWSVPVVLNPDTVSRPADGVLGSDALFFEVKPESERLIPLLNKDLYDAMTDNRLSVKGAAIHDYGDVLFQFGTNVVRMTSKIAAVGYLCRAHGVYADVAQEIVAKAAAAGRCDFEIKANELTDKVAGTLPIHPVMDPYWQQGFDSNVNAITERPQTFSIPTVQQKVELPPQRIGDGWDPDRGRNALLSEAPQQLADFARENNIPSLLDHGDVGALIKAYDAGSMMDRLLPKLEDALDGIGRMYFMIEWKPEDFKTMYGDEDLPRKKAETLSNFKSVGDMVLDFSKRSRELEADSARDRAPINS